MGRPALRVRTRTLDATIVRTAISRTVIDVNRDPSGASLYPGQATTELCPTHDVRRRAALSERRGARRGRDRETQGALVRTVSRGLVGRAGAVARRARAGRALRRPLDPFVGPAAVRGHPAPLQHRHKRRSELCARTDSGGGSRVRRDVASAASPTGGFGAAGSPAITGSRKRACTRSRWSSPAGAICAEPIGRVDETNWPPPFDDAYAAPMMAALSEVLRACVRLRGIEQSEEHDR